MVWLWLCASVWHPESAIAHSNVKCALLSVCGPFRSLSSLSVGSHSAHTLICHAEKFKMVFEYFVNATGRRWERYSANENFARKLRYAWFLALLYRSVFRIRKSVVFCIFHQHNSAELFARHGQSTSQFQLFVSNWCKFVYNAISINWVLSLMRNAPMGCVNIVQFWRELRRFSHPN